MVGDAVYPMGHTLGAPDRGIYEVEVGTPDAGCVDYYFVYEDDQGDRGAFPETGAYRFGPDCDSEWRLRATTRSPWGADDPTDPGPGGEGAGDDPAADFGDGGADAMDVSLSGCSGAGGRGAGLGWLGLVGLIALGGRRRS